MDSPASSVEGGAAAELKMDGLPRKVGRSLSTRNILKSHVLKDRHVPKRFGVRTLLMWLVLVAAVPSVGLAIYGVLQAEHDAVDGARQELKSVALLAAANQQQVVEGVRQILSAVVSGPSVRRDDLLPLCLDFLRNMVAANPAYGNIGVADMKGDVRCQGERSNTPFNVADRAYFKNSIETRQFSVGEYVLGRVTGKKLLAFGMPIVNDGGELHGVAFAAIDLLSANQRLQALPLSEHMQMQLADSHGNLLVSTLRHPADIGMPMADPKLLAVIRGTPHAGSLKTVDVHGDAWLHELVPLTGTGGGGLYVLASTREEPVLALAAERLRQQLLVLAGATALGLLLAWRLSEKQFAAPVSRLLERMRRATDEASFSDLAVRATSREFAELEAGFADMWRSLQQQQQQLLKVQQITRVGFFELDLTNRLFKPSPIVQEMLGLEPRATPISLEQYQTYIHPDDLDRVQQHRKRMFAGATPRRLQYRLVRPDGKIRWLDGFGFVQRDENGAPMTYSGAIQDITEQQRLRSLLIVQSRINEAIVITDTPLVLYEQACQIAVRDGEMRMVWVAMADATTGRLDPVVHAGHDNGYLDLLRACPSASADSEAWRPAALRQGSVTLSNDIGSDPRMLPWRVAALSRGYEAMAIAPIQVDGRTVAAIVFMAAEANYFQEQELSLIEAIGASLSRATASIESERIRQATETQLKLLETCVARLNDIVVITEAEPFDEPGPKILFVNDAFERRTGYTRAEVIGRSPRLLQGPKTQRDALDRIRTAMQRWQPVREELINHTKDGQEFWIELDIVPIADPTGWFTHFIAIQRDITERKRAELQEAEHSESLRLLFLGNPHPMWVFDVATWAFLEVNRAAIAQYGYSREEFLAMTIHDIRPTEEEERLRRHQALPPASGLDRAGAWTHRRKNGELLLVDITSQRLSYLGRDAELVVAMDMTQRIAADAAREQALISLHESQARLARAQSLARMGSWERLAADRSGAWSEGFFELTGRDPALGTPTIAEYAAMLHPDDAAAFEAALNQSLLNGQAHRWRYRFRNPDGRLRWFEETINEPVRGPAGQVVAVNGTVQDVTESHEAVLETQTQLARTELLNAIARAIDSRLDLEGIFNEVCTNLEAQFSVAFAAACLYDPQAEKIQFASLGPNGQERLAPAGLTPGDLMSVDDSAVIRCVEGNLVYEPDIASSRFASLQRLAQAGLRSVVLAPLHVERKVFAVLIAARDAAAAFSSAECEFMRQLGEHVALAATQAQLHGQLQMAYDQLQQTQQQVIQQERLRVLGQMASGIAHDINNAISPIVLYAESLLARETGLSERGRGQLTVIQTAIDDVAETVARMREFYRPIDPQAQRKPVDLNRLVHQGVDLTRARWRDIPQQSGVNIELSLELEAGLPLVHAVVGELRDALINLVLNAADAMPNGGTLRLRTRQLLDERGATTVQIDVGDTGVGMSEETLSRCFDPFFTTKGERGSGLGLASVHGAMKRNEGSMSIDSTLGIGTTVRLRFPVLGRTLHEPPGATESPAEAASALHILLIDDDPLVLRSLRETLMHEGHRVETAAGGQNGIDAFNAARSGGREFDLVITDLGMPRVDGRAVAQAVKAVSSETSVLMLTGWGRQMQQEGERPPHVDHLMSKPPRLADLRQVIAACGQRGAAAHRSL